MESWRKVWREGVAPLLSLAGLEALAMALHQDDPGLMQGVTCLAEPPEDPIAALGYWRPKGGCAIALAGWRGEQMTRTNQVEEFFAGICAEVDRRFGEAAATRWFLNWFDETPRDAMRAALLPEVLRAIAERAPLLTPQIGGAAC